MVQGEESDRGRSSPKAVCDGVCVRERLCVRTRARVCVNVCMCEFSGTAALVGLRIRKAVVPTIRSWFCDMGVFREAMPVNAMPH